MTVPAGVRAFKSRAPFPFVATDVAPARVRYIRLVQLGAVQDVVVILPYQRIALSSGHVLCLALLLLPCVIWLGRADAVEFRDSCGDEMGMRSMTGRGFPIFAHGIYFASLTSIYD